MRLVLLGAPGSGKGTQGHRLAAHYKIPEISTGDLLREAVAAATPLGRAAKTVMDAGQLVSDDLVLGVIRERLARPDARKGFILDGFPRNLSQAEQLDELLDQIGQPIDLAVLIRVNVDLILQRLLGRRTCVSCGASYNIFYAPPRMDDSCDECGGRLKRRPDDNEETIGNRLRIYETQTAPVIARYREQERLRVIDGIGDIGDVFKALTKAIDEARPAFNADRSAAIRRAVARAQQHQQQDNIQDEAAAVARQPSKSAKPGIQTGRAKEMPKKTAPAKAASAGNKSAMQTAARKAGTSKAPPVNQPGKKPVAGNATAKKTPLKKAAPVSKTVASKKNPGKQAKPAASPVHKKTAKKKIVKKSVARKAPSKKAASGRLAKAVKRSAGKPSLTRKTTAKTKTTRKQALRRR